MKKIDYDYIAENISSLSKISVRIFLNRQQTGAYHPARFPKDPASPYLHMLLQIDEGVSYYISPYEHFYGIVRHGDHALILGPTFQIAPSREKIREFMFSLNLKSNYMEQYRQFLNSITPMPLELFLHELCLIYYYISDRKLNVADVVIYDSHSRITKQNQSKKTALMQNSLNAVADAHAAVSSESANGSGVSHNSVWFEKEMLSCVREGDPKRLEELFRHHSAGRPGKVASTYLRQLKNIFISTATLLSRAAIDGGLPAEEALTLSDRYIQHAENYQDPEQIMNLQYHMVIDYATLVNEIRNGVRYDRFTRTAVAYIREHLSEDFSMEQMARDLYISRSYLSAKFKEETGMTLSQYKQKQRILKAQSLLKTTDRSILAIATYLGFSSQGYFQNIFKKITGMTPKAYRSQ